MQAITFQEELLNKYNNVLERECMFLMDSMPHLQDAYDKSDVTLMQQIIDEQKTCLGKINYYRKKIHEIEMDTKYNCRLFKLINYDNNYVHVNMEQSHQCPGEQAMGPGNQINGSEYIFLYADVKNRE